MTPRRSEMIEEIVSLAKQNTLEKVAQPDLLGKLSDGDLHALLMVIKAHRGIEDCLLQDALGHQVMLVPDNWDEETAFAMKAWGA
jgi:hypothetical protein